MAEIFDLERLSQREREILNFAINGLTDQQIAVQLTISASTVNSYWVRIRSKLGHLSRTELVASALRRQAQNELKELQAQSAHFEELALRRGQDNENVAHAEMYRAIIDAFPDPAFATDASGKILFANPMLGSLLQYKPEELMGQAAAMLFPERDRVNPFTDISAFAKGGNPVRIGIQDVVYARRKDRQLTRVSLAVGGAATSRGMVFTAILRSFADEIDTARRRAAATIEDLLYSPEGPKGSLRLGSG